MINAISDIASVKVNSTNTLSGKPLDIDFINDSRWFSSEVNEFKRPTPPSIITNHLKEMESLRKKSLDAVNKSVKEGSFENYSIAHATLSEFSIHNLMLAKTVGKGVNAIDKLVHMQ